MVLFNMSVLGSDIVTDAVADNPLSQSSQNSRIHAVPTHGVQEVLDSASEETTVIFNVTSPSDDIKTDAVPDAPRPRGTPIGDPPRARENSDEYFPRKSPSFSRARTKNSGKRPAGFFNGRIPGLSNSSTIVNISNCSDVQIGHTFQIGVPNNNPQNETQENKLDAPPPKYEVLLSSQKVVTDIHLNCVADNVGRKWKLLAGHLRIQEAALFRLENDYRDDHRERVYQLLLEWKQSIGGPDQAPLLARLSTALWAIRERDALDSLVKIENDARLKIPTK